jgi:hypothetical protein
MIYRKMNIGTMILGQENGAGAYAQSQTQFDTLSIFLDGIHEDIAAELQSKIVELVDMNWNVDDYPVISFETFEETDLLQLLGVLIPAAKDMVIDADDSWFRHLIADVVSRYSDVDTGELLEEKESSEEQGENEQQVVSEPTVQPTPEEQQQKDEETAGVIEKLNLPNAKAPGE